MTPETTSQINLADSLANNPFYELASHGASQENTPELQSFWLQKYIDMLSSGKFVISSKTEELLLTDMPIERPATPYGDLVLVRFLKPNNSLDEISFQDIIETAVRFLDAMVDSVNFVPNAKFVVSQYRKIGLGIIDFSEYLSRRRTSEIQEIDYIGDLLANNAYRASEALAEEKGACQNWPMINKHIRPKLFEMWKNSQTKGVLSSLEIAEEVGSGTAIDDNWSIIPRRNSALLLLPKNLEWQIWSDRDETAPKTEFKQIETNLPTPTLEPISASNSNSISNSFDTNTALATEQMPQIGGVESSQIETEQNTSRNPDLEINTTLQQIANQNTENAKQRLASIDSNNSWMSAGNDPANPFETIYQIGELIKIRKPESLEFGKVFQIIEAVANKGGKGYSYRITDGELESERKLWQEKDFVPVDLLDVLEKMNDFEKIETELTAVKKTLINPAVVLEAIILDTDQDHFLALDVDGKILLPSLIWNAGFSIETAFKSFLYNEYTLTANGLEIVGSVDYIAEGAGLYSLHIGIFVSASFNQPSAKLHWQSFAEVDVLPTHSIKLLQKYLILDTQTTKTVLDTTANSELEAEIQMEIQTETQTLLTENEILANGEQNGDLDTDIVIETENNDQVDEQTETETTNDTQILGAGYGELSEENVDNLETEMDNSSNSNNSYYGGVDANGQEIGQNSEPQSIEEEVATIRRIIPITSYDGEVEDALDVDSESGYQAPTDGFDNVDDVLEDLQSTNQIVDEIEEKTGLRFESPTEIDEIETEISEETVTTKSPMEHDEEVDTAVESEIQGETKDEIAPEITTEIAPIAKPKAKPSTNSALLSILKRHQ